MSKKIAKKIKPKRRKYVRSTEENAKVVRSRARALKAAVETDVVDAYLTDEMRDYRCPVLTLEEILERTGMSSDQFLTAVFLEQCHGYMKAALRKAVRDGIPAVLVNRRFCNDVSLDEYESADDIDTMKSWLAGMGPRSKAAGILFVFGDDDTASAMFLISANHLVKVSNGLIRQTVATFEAGAAKQLAHMGSRTSLIRNLRKVKLLPALS